MLKYVIYTKEFPWDPNKVVGQAGSEFAAKAIVNSFCKREMIASTVQPYKSGYCGDRHVNYDMGIEEGTRCYIWYEDTKEGS